MRSTRKLTSFLIIFFLSPVFSINAASGDIIWQDISRGIKDLNLQVVAVSPDNPEIVYAGSINTIYKTKDGGENWEEALSFKGTGNTVNAIAVNPLNPKVLFAGTREGLYRSINQGTDWSRIFTGVGELNAAVLSIAVNPINSENIFIGTKAGLFWTDTGGGTWRKAQNLPNDAAVSSIAIDFFNPEIIYAVTEKGFFKSINGAVDWKRMLESSISEKFNIDNDSASNQTEDVEINEAGTEIKSIVINPTDAGMLYLGTSKGMLTSRDAGVTWKAAGRAGLISRDIRHLIINRADLDGVYAATGRGVFRYSVGSENWKELYKGLTALDIRFLAVQHNPSALWAAAGKGIFKTSAAVQNAAFSDSGNKSREILSAFADEPAIEEVQKAAIRYAEVHPEKIEDWRRAAQKKAWLPHMTLGYNKGRDWQNSSYYTGGVYYGDDITRGKDYDWSVAFTWELGELLWNNDQTSIDTRSRLMVQLRDDVLNEVTRLYFERRRLQFEMLLSPPEGYKDRMEKELRVQELTADIDALTDFYFSKRLRNKGQVASSK
ncbi:MAG: hypothetical protein HY759_05085 [Nitrospirae bacterium]|nr:hypothetical protein [Nitrospirota bacterium]